MYSFKLIDIVLQGVAFLSAMVLLAIFSASGYFFWIKVCLIVWILMSMVLNFILYKSISSMRKITTLILLILFFIFLISYLLDVPIPRLNFYFQPLSIIVIFVYLFMSFFELNKMKSKGDIDLDF
jgi:O-antigen ligase